MEVIGLLADGQTFIEKFVTGMGPWLAQYAGPIVQIGGVVLIIVGFVQLARYIGGKSNGGGQSRVSAFWSVLCLVVGAAFIVGGTFIQSTTQNGNQIVDDISGKGGNTNNTISFGN